MQLKAGQKIIDFFRGKKRNDTKSVGYAQYQYKNLTTEEQNNFKYNAWKPEGIGQYYENNVEKLFFNSVIKDYFCEYIKPTDKVLDVGAGTGRLSIALAESGCDVTAADISSEMLKIIDENKGNLNIKTVVANCEELPFEDNSFDSVVALDAMIHFKEWPKFLKEQTRVAKQGGIIAFNIFSGENMNLSGTKDKDTRSFYITDGYFVASVTKEELEEVCKPLGLEIAKIQPYNFFGYSNTLAKGILTEQESIQFSAMANKMMNNKKFAEVITKIEKTVIKDLPAEYCSQIIVVLKKK